MKKIYNLIIAVLIVALIVVIAMIILRYGGNHLNEKEVSASIVEIEEKLNPMSVMSFFDKLREDVNAYFEI